uniref:Peptidase M16 N-terminal domain-containing protein n=1 Tax=viral metagenome TaxID=1070528 RepID=A0A6C0EBY8_9ZZZZ
MSLEKSSNDNRNYEYYVLDNMLKVLLISDDKMLDGSCVLTVGVGSAQEKVNGLAHFLEHMLFMGSEKYPDESYFMNYISKNGGMTNAFTANTQTTYFFTIKMDKLIEAMDILAQFFISPLLKQNSVNREMKAVNAEHSKNLSNDQRILYELQKKIYVKNHPYKHFSTGTYETLNLPNIYDELRKFHKKYYASQLMNLVIGINNTIKIDELKKIIADTFGKIAKNDTVVVHKYGPIVESKKIVRCVPDNNINTISLLFNIASVDYKNHKDISFVLLHILSHEGKNSFFDAYKDNGWIFSILGEINEQSDDYSVVRIHIKLSDEGFKNRKDIIKNIIEYVKVMKQSCRTEEFKKLYDERVQMYKNNFELWSVPDISDFSIAMSSKLLTDVDPRELISFPTKFTSYENIIDDLEKVLIDLANENLSLVMCSKYYEDKYDKVLKKHKYYKTRYMIEQFEKFGSKNNNNITFQLPDYNKYVATNYKLINDVTMSTPLKLGDNIYYIFNSSFKMPLATIMLTFTFPYDMLTEEKFAAMHLLHTAIMHDYNAEMYLISTSDNHVMGGYDRNKFTIHISGFNDKLNELADFAIKMFNHIPTEKALTSSKLKIKDMIEEFKTCELLLRMPTYIDKMLLKNAYTPIDIEDQIDKLTIDRCINIQNELLSKVERLVYVSGNVTVDYANSIIKKITDGIKYNEYKLTDTDRDDLIKYDTCEINVVKNINKTTPDSFVGYCIYLFSYIMKDEWWNYMIFQLIAYYILENPFFDSLRTKQQLGYIVRLMPINKGDTYYNNMYLQFFVQSNNKISFIQDRIDEFIDNYSVKVLKMTDDEFENYKIALIEKYKKPFQTLEEFSNHYYSCIVDKSFAYDFKEVMIKQIPLFTKDRFLEMYKKYIMKRKTFICCIEN